MMKTKVIKKTTTKTKVSEFKSFLFPYSNPTAWKKVRGSLPRCFQCDTQITESMDMGIGIAIKGTNSTFCVFCILEFRDEGLEVIEREVQKNDG